MNLAPILLFTYKRLEPVKKTVEALKKNTLAKESELFIFSDGPKNKNDAEQIENVRNYIKTIDGFKKIVIKEENNNKGLANSIIGGVSEILKNNEAVIVLEDDLITSTNFLQFMNQALLEYKTSNNVFSIAGYTIPIKNKKGYNYDNYFTQRASSWGWGTWKSRWEKIDWNVSDYESFVKDSKAKKRFNKMGSDMTKMLADQMSGTINSWAIRWCYHQFKINGYTVNPIISKIENIGFGEASTHTDKIQESRFATILDISNKVDFNFNKEVILDKWFTKQFVATYNIKTRVYYKIRSILKL